MRWIPEHNWHITLRFVGDADAGQLIEALGDVALPRVSATVGTRPQILARTSLVLPVNGVDRLAAAVRAATAGIGRAEDPVGRFVGHLTVARTRGGRPIRPNPDAGELPAPIDHDVDEVAVVAATLSPQGAIYETVATFRTSAVNADGVGAAGRPGIALHVEYRCSSRRPAVTQSAS